MRSAVLLPLPRNKHLSSIRIHVKSCKIKHTLDFIGNNFSTVVTCPSLGVVSNGIIEYNSTSIPIPSVGVVSNGIPEYHPISASGRYSVGTTASASCDSGYFPTDPTPVTCLETGEWTDTFV